MEAAQDELKLFTEVMRCAREAKEKDPTVEINVVALENNFLFSGVKAPTCASFTSVWEAVCST